MRPTSKPASETDKAGAAPLVVTAGEPAGIGPDLCIALGESAYADRLVVIGDAMQLTLRARMLRVDLRIHEYNPGMAFTIDGPGPQLCVLSKALPEPSVCGTPHTANAKALLDGLLRAVDGCQSGEFSALVTAPLQKSIINDAGIAFTGHTEFLAQHSGCRNPVMLLVAAELRVALASTHLPLRAVADYLNEERLKTVIEVLHRDLIDKFGIADPEIIVCGLNPHAGEGGHLGTEDQEIILPVINDMQRHGIKVRGPVPADTAFTPAAGQADAVLAMYHDQGLPVLKYAGFGNAVNVTLGLPIVRTSVDHGTALDIAGSGKADIGSMLAAVELAVALTER